MPRFFTAHIHEYGPRLTSKELVYVGVELGKVLTLSFQRRPEMQTDNYLFFLFSALTLGRLGLKMM